MKTYDTTPGSPRRAELKAQASPPRPLASPRPSVTLTEDDLLHLTSDQVYAALAFTPKSYDEDHEDNITALDRAVRALLDVEMDKQENK